MACASLSWLVIHCIVQLWCSNKSKKKKKRLKQQRLSGVSNMSQVQEMSCRCSFTTCKKKPKLTRETCIIKKYTSCFQTAMKTSPSDNSRHSKRYPAFDLNYIKRLPKYITQAYWNHLESKTFSKMSCYKTLWQIDWCTSNNSQKHFSEMDKV